jgi:hypothetical protein
MKSLAIALLVALTMLGLAAGVHAQAPSSGGSAVPAAAGDAKDRVDADRKGDAVSPAPTAPNRNDDVSALPRATTSAERTTIFGLTPTAAIVIAAALLVVVILAIVAMTRSNDTYFEP